MWVVYTKLYRGEGWQTEQRELPLPVSEIERWAKGQGVVPCLAYDEREVLWSRLSRGSCRCLCRR